MATTNYKEAFALFDKRGNNLVQSSSLGDLLRACGQNPTNAEVEELVRGVKPERMSTITIAPTVFNTPPPSSPRPGLLGCYRRVGDGRSGPQLELSAGLPSLPTAQEQQRLAPGGDGAMRGITGKKKRAEDKGRMVLTEVQLISSPSSKSSTAPTVSASPAIPRSSCAASRCLIRT